MVEELEIRKEKLFSILKKGTKIWVAIAIILIAFMGYNIRIQNLPNLIDSTTNNYIPIELDSFVILRYAEYFNENGNLMENDKMRYYPRGFDPRKEFTFIAGFVSYLYNFMHAFNKEVTIEFADVVYPPVTFFFAVIFFFLFIKNLFNYKIALVASYILTVIPIFLHRTIAGFSDKEALATMLIFMAFYFYTNTWRVNKTWKFLTNSLLAGITTTLAVLAWGGSTLITFVIAAFILFEIFLNKASKRDLIRDFIWSVSTVFLLTVVTNRYSIVDLISSLTTTLLVFAIPLIIIYYLINFKNTFKLKDKYQRVIPVGILSGIISIGFALIISTIFISPSFVFDKGKDLLVLATNPYGTSRWGLTVAESQQPYFIDWVSNIGKFFVYLFMIGSIIFFYDMIKKLKLKYYLIAIYTIFILSFTMSRYSASSVFNGVSAISKIFYLGSLALFVLILLYLYLKYYYKDKEEYNKIINIDKTYLFVFVWFLFLVVAARGAIRALYIFAPVVVLLATFIIFRFGEYIWSFKKFYIRAIGISIILFLFLAPMIQGNVYNFTRSIYAQAKYSGPLYNQQWQSAGQWIRENTPKEAVFAHWWDYGYWVQGGGERATITDGGNAVGALNHWMGRYVLTGNTETEALEFLKARDATFLLMVSDEIGKYPAFSAIGGDENYDRFSWITTFSLDMANTQETRDNFVYIFTGSYPFDDDFVWEGTVFPRRSSGIGAILLPIAKNLNNSQIDLNNVKFAQPTVVVVKDGQQTNIPLECIFIGGQEIVFEKKGISGCLRLIPTISRDGKMNPIGAGLYLSPDVRKTLFTKLYLYGLETDYFKVAYTDESRVPLALYEGSLVGPIKIWEISYPTDLKVPQYFYGDNLVDPNVTKVNIAFY